MKQTGSLRLQRVFSLFPSPLPVSYSVTPYRQMNTITERKPNVHLHMFMYITTVTHKLFNWKMDFHECTRLLSQAGLAHTHTHTQEDNATCETFKLPDVWNMSVFTGSTGSLYWSVCVYWCGVHAHVQKFNFKELGIICQFNCACVCTCECANNSEIIMFSFSTTISLIHQSEHTIFDFQKVCV